MKEMSLVFRFVVTIDDRKLDVVNRPGDALRMRARLGGGTELDERLKGGGVDAYEVMFMFAWCALRHHEEYTTLEWDDFIDRCETWAVGDDEEGPTRPTGAGASSAP